MLQHCKARRVMSFAWNSVMNPNPNHNLFGSVRAAEFDAVCHDLRLLQWPCSGFLCWFLRKTTPNSLLGLFYYALYFLARHSCLHSMKSEKDRSINFDYYDCLDRSWNHYSGCPLWIASTQNIKKDEKNKTQHEAIPAFTMDRFFGVSFKTLESRSLCHTLRCIFYYILWLLYIVFIVSIRPHRS